MSSAAKLFRNGSAAFRPGELTGIFSARNLTAGILLIVIVQFIPAVIESFEHDDEHEDEQDFLRRNF